MKFALCNEMFEKESMAETCKIARDLGYHGIEIAPFTLSKWAGDISKETRREVRSTVEDHGLETVGLHWLFVGPEGLHMTAPDESVTRATVDYIRTLIELCADLGGDVLVFGSPKQRNVAEGQDRQDAWDRAIGIFGETVQDAADAGVTMCLEPLSPVETNFINTVGEGMEMVRALDHPNFKIHLDIKAMWSEPSSVPEVIRSVAASDVGHFHVNDPNLYGPGMGDFDYAPVAEATKAIGWDKWLSVEVFKYDPDPETIARKSIEYMKRFFS